MDDVVEIVQSWAAQIDQLFQTMGFWNMMTHLPTRIVFQMGGFICGTKNGNDQQNDFIS